MSDVPCMFVSCAKRRLWDSKEGEAPNNPIPGVVYDMKKSTYHEIAAPVRDWEVYTHRTT